MLSQLVRNLSEIARERDITIYRNFVDNDYSTLLIDEDKIYEAIYNIIDNAIKYSPNGGYIKINAKENEKRYYERIGIHYTFPSLGGLTIGGNVKAHLTKADLTEFVVSYPIKF